MNDIAVSRGARSVLSDMADRYGMEPRNFEATVRATCFPVRKPEDVPTPEEFAAFLLVAKVYELNPLLREIYAFRTKAGGIQPIVSIDGWMNLMNSHPQMDGLEFEDHLDTKQGNKLVAVTARVWRKDRTKPTMVTEYLEECYRDDSPVWKQWPRRMLRHKAAIQAARYAFGFSGIVDPDEADRIGSDTGRLTYTQAQRVLAPSPDEQARRVAPPIREVEEDDDEQARGGTFPRPSSDEVSAQALQDTYEANLAKAQAMADARAREVAEQAKPKRRPGRPPKAQPAPEAPSLQWEEGPEARAAALARFPSQAEPLKAAAKPPPAPPAPPAPPPQTSEQKVTTPEPDQEPYEFDPWKHIEDVVGRMRSAKSLSDVEEIYTIDCEPHRDDFQFPSDWEEIEEAYRAAKVRLSK